MRLLLTSAILVALLALLNCRVAEYGVGEWPPQQISFGQGGGFAGMEETIVLLPNGQRFRQNRVGADWVSQSSISRGIAREYFQIAKSRIYGEVALTPIANTYSFIAYRDQDRTARLTWSGAPDNLDPEIARLIEHLFELN